MFIKDLSTYYHNPLQTDVRDIWKHTHTQTYIHIYNKGQKPEIIELFCFLISE